MIRAIVILAALGCASALLHPREYYEERFVDWMIEHKVTFESGEEFVQRLKTFAEADDYIEAHNSGNHTFTLGHNAYSHLTPEEFRQRMGLGAFNPLNKPRTGEPQQWPGGHGYGATYLNLADEIDWVKSGAVTEVKNQGQCGSCWSFSTTGALEGAYFIKNQRLESFSEQMLVDCDMVDAHCNGGLMDNAFEWIQNNGGLCAEGDYPYEGAEGKCRAKTCELVKGSKVASWVDVHPTETALMAALNEGPVSVAIEADQMQFQLYKSGVFTARCGNQLDHGVLAVGYGKAEDGTLYWRVKNSWGPTWGQDGYILLERNVKQRGGQCGIALSASYPKL